MKKMLCLFISIFFIGSNLALAKEKVTFSKCVDGDTFRVIVNEEDKTVRLRNLEKMGWKQNIMQLKLAIIHVM